MSATAPNALNSALAVLRWDFLLVLSAIEDVVAGKKPNLDLLRSAHARLSSGHQYGCPSLKPLRSRIVMAAAWVKVVHTALTGLPLSRWTQPDVLAALNDARSHIEPLFADLTHWATDVWEGREPAFNAPPSRARAFAPPNPDARRDH